MRKLLVLSLLVFLPGCPTTFIGDAHVRGGAAGCKSICSGMGMQLAGMVVMGEYSDGCVCQVPGAAPVPTASIAPAAAGPAVDGVMMQTQRSQQQASFH